MITSRIEDELSELLLRSKIACGNTVVVDVDPAGGFTFHTALRRKETASDDS